MIAKNRKQLFTSLHKLSYQFVLVVTCQIINLLQFEVLLPCGMLCIMTVNNHALHACCHVNLCHSMQSSLS